MLSEKRVFVAGHNGMVGGAICRLLSEDPNVTLITRSRTELDLTDQKATEEFFSSEKPDEVFLAAAKVGGIYANSTFPAEFIFENLQIQNNVVSSSHRNGVQKLLFLGSSCIYPKFAKQPIRESALLSGTLEPTNEPYAIAKIAGIKLCDSYNRQHGRDYRSVMPTNLYGPGDNFDSQNGHVIPSLMRRIFEAKNNGQSEVVIWGTGKPLREFLYVEDLASAAVYVHGLSSTIWESAIEGQTSHINVGTGIDVSILELANILCDEIGFKGKLVFDHSKPDGTPRKVLSVDKINTLGWKARTELTVGIARTFDYFKRNVGSGKIRV